MTTIKKLIVIENTREEEGLPPMIARKLNEVIEVVNKLVESENAREIREEEEYYGEDL